MNILEKALAERARDQAEIASEKSKALDFMVEVAARELNYESRPSDASDLLSVIEECGLTLADYQELLQVLPKIAKLTARCEEAKQVIATRDLIHLRREQIRKRSEAALAKLNRQIRMLAVFQETVADYDRKLGLINRQFPIVFDDNGNLRPAALTVKAPERPQPEPLKQCKFCEIDIPQSTEGDYCGFPCQRDGEALEALLPKKGKK